MDKTTKKLAIGTLVAGAVGYVAGILTAPKSGKETRKDIQQAAVKARVEGEKKLKALHSELQERIDQGKEQATKLKDKARKELDTVLQRANTTKQRARELLSAIREGDADNKDLDKVIADVNDAVKHLNKYLDTTNGKQKS